MGNTTAVLKRKSYPACGRLIIIQRGFRQLSPTENNQQNEAINFPAMPDGIELARQADYMVTTNLVIPDGIHFYRGTQPLKIPISFKLHSYDEEFCPKGALSLLHVASTLHALVLPIGQSSIPVTVGMTQPTTTTGGTEAMQKANAATDVTQIFDSSAKGNIFPPVTCYLELIVTERNLPGILCIGYVENVSVRLNGPFLRGPGISRNLPSSADFSFTFVHHPGHGNAFTEHVRGINAEPQAYADVVRSRFYNTHTPDSLSGNYRGFGQTEASASPFN